MLLMTSGNSVWFVFVCREYCQAFVSLMHLVCHIGSASKAVTVLAVKKQGGAMLLTTL